MQEKDHTIEEKPETNIEGLQKEKEDEFRDLG